jgi:hypothetical protein
MTLRRQSGDEPLSANLIRRLTFKLTKKAANENILVGGVEKKRLNKGDSPVITLAAASTRSRRSKQKNVIAAWTPVCPLETKNQNFGGKSLRKHAFRPFSLARSTPFRRPASGRAGVVKP